MNTNQKGVIGESKVISDLIEKGYNVFQPFSGHSNIDIIVSNNDAKLIKLQIKYRKLSNGILIIPLENVINGKKVSININLIDGWAIYCPDNDCIYYLNKNDIHKGNHCFRIIEVKKEKRNKLPVTDLNQNPDIFFG